MTAPVIAPVTRRLSIALLLRLIPFGIALGSAIGTEAPRVGFDLPPDNAEASLKRLSQQSGVEVLFPTDAVDGVRTNRVKGEMTARQALDAMLVGTALIAVEGTSTSSLTVKRREPAGEVAKASPKDAQPPPSEAGRDSQKKNEIMTNPNQEPTKTNSLLTKLAAAFGLLLSPAEAQVAPAGDRSPAIPQQEELIELSPFTVSAESDDGWVATSSLAGSRLNTPLRDTGASINVLTSEFLMDIGAIDLEEAVGYAVNVHETVTRENSTNDNWAMEHFDTGRMNIRGIPATVTRNYFRRHLQTDSYNADRIEENRGPNSILFGIGSAGGILNTQTKQAMVNRDFRRGSVMTGSYGSYRATTDINQRLLDGRLAVRVNAVYGHMESYRHHIYNDTQRINFATTFQPRPTTRLRLDYEVGKIEQVTARGTPPLNGVTGWIAAGSPLLAAPQAANANLGISRFGSGQRLVYVDNLGAIYNYAGQNRSVSHNLVLLDQSLADFSVNHAGPGNLRDGEFHNLSLFWEERVGERTFVELAHNLQRNDSDATITGQSRSENGHMHADPHLFLPNGGPNPYAGEFFFEGDRFNRIINNNRTHSTRLTISHEMDFGKWGNYRIAAMGEYEWRNDARRVLTEAWSGSPFHVNPEGTPNIVFRRRYATQGDWASYHLGGPLHTGLIQGVQDPTNPNRTLSSTWVPFNQGGQRNPYEYQRTILLGGQARYFDNRLALGLGVRRDKLDIKTYEAIRDPASNAWTVDHPDIEPLIQGFAGTTSTMGAVGHVTQNFSLFYNFSNSLDLPNTGHRILPDGRPPPSPEAQGHDFGLGFSFFDGRLAGRANAFTVDLINATGGGFGGTFSNPMVLNDRVLDGLLAAGVITSAVHDQRSFTTNNAIRDQKLEGYEFNLTGTMTRNWNISLNYSYTDGYDNRIAPEIRAWAAEALPWMLQHSNVLINVEGEMVPVAQEVARWQANADSEWLREGDLILGNRKHKASVFTRYSFDEGPLRGLFVGGGYRYHSAAPTNFNNNDEIEWGNSRGEADALIGYRFENSFLFFKRGLRIQLNVKNVFDNTDPRIVRQFSHTGTTVINRVNLEAPRSWRLTANFEF